MRALVWRTKGDGWVSGESSVPGAQWAYELVTVQGGYEVTRCSDGKTVTVRSLSDARTQAEDWERTR